MYMVTGGAGFIGSHIAERLVRDGKRVRVFDLASNASRFNHDASVSNGIEWIEGNIGDADALGRAMIGVEVVFHQAAEVSVQRSVANPEMTYDINVLGTLNVLTAARQAGCRRVVFASSSAVYGETPELPKHEALLPSPVSPYAATKIAGEHLCAVFARLYGIETVALRYFNVFGPRQDPSSSYAAAIPRFVAALQRNEQPVVYGDGEQTRDFVYITDVVDANIRASRQPDVSGNVYNVASGRSVSVNQVLRALSQVTGETICPIYASPRSGDIQHSLADITLATRDLGFEPKVEFEEGLATTVAALRESIDQ